MFIRLIFSYLLTVPLIYGNTLDNIEKKTNTTVRVANSTLQNDISKSKITVASEGGAIMSNTPALSSLPSDAAISMTENVVKGNKIKARKGAFKDPADDHEDLSSKYEVNDTADVKLVLQNIKPINNSKNINLGLNSTKSANSSSPSIPETNITRVHKPTVLSAEAIAKLDDPTIDLDDQNVQRNGVHDVNSNKNPGMVMPVVITILVVPMFAVIGYMVLKRGKEAWKNRHYKRMDFLLDGMYND